MSEMPLMLKHFQAAGKTAEILSEETCYKYTVYMTEYGIISKCEDKHTGRVATRGTNWKHLYYLNSKATLTVIVRNMTRATKDLQRSDRRWWSQQF